MNPNPTCPYTQEGIEKELEALAPLVHRAFERASGPSPKTLAAIREEARRQVFLRGRTRRLMPLFRSVAAAASLALLLAGAIHIHWIRVDGRHARDVAHLLNLGAAQPTSGVPDSSALANSLLDVQGLSEEAFLATADETESLWL